MTSRIHTSDLPACRRALQRAIIAAMQSERFVQLVNEQLGEMLNAESLERLNDGDAAFAELSGDRSFVEMLVPRAASGQDVGASVSLYALAQEPDDCVRCNAPGAPFDRVAKAHVCETCAKEGQ